MSHKWLHTPDCKPFNKMEHVCVQVPASCSGPTIILALQPHECLLDDSTKQVTCKPAQLVLTKLAGMTSNITVVTRYLHSTYTVVTRLLWCHE